MVFWPKASYHRSPAATPQDNGLKHVVLAEGHNHQRGAGSTRGRIGNDRMVFWPKASYHRSLGQRPRTMG